MGEHSGNKNEGQEKHRFPLLLVEFVFLGVRKRHHKCMDEEWMESGVLPEAFSPIMFIILNTLNQQLHSDRGNQNGENSASGQMTKCFDHSYVLLIGNSYC